jgi:hypothetical protein
MKKILGAINWPGYSPITCAVHRIKSRHKETKDHRGMLAKAPSKTLSRRD